MLAEEAQMSAQLSAQQQVVLDELRAQYQITNRATENLDGKPIKAYTDLLKSCRNNFRLALKKVADGAMLAGSGQNG